MNLQLVLDTLEDKESPNLDFGDLDQADWEQLARAVRHRVLPRRALIAIIQAGAGRHEAIPVLAELTSDLGVPLAISRALLTEDSVEQLMSIIEDSGLQAAFECGEPPERLVLPLARTLGDPRAWLWLARGVFHSSVVTMVPERIRDSDVAIRLAAVEALTNTPGDKAIEALYPALHDASPEVQQAALKGLRVRCDDEGLRTRLDRELSEITAIVERAHSTRHNFLQRIPGLSRLMTAWRR